MAGEMGETHSSSFQPNTTSIIQYRLHEDFIAFAYLPTNYAFSQIDYLLSLFNHGLICSTDANRRDQSNVCSKGYLVGYASAGQGVMQMNFGGVIFRHSWWKGRIKGMSMST
jgi:hypothetical protein